MSNCVVGSDGGGTPLGVVTEHSVEGYNHLAHHGNDDDLGLFASGGEALGEGFKSGIVSACAQGCHVENITHGHATPIDTAVSLKLSAVKVVGRETDQGGDLLAIDLAELRQGGEERKGEGRADARHGDEQPIAVGETRIGGNKLGQPFVQEKNIGLQPHQPALAKTPQHGVLKMSCLVHSGSRRGSPHDPVPVILHHAPFPTYKAARHDDRSNSSDDLTDADMFGKLKAAWNRLSKGTSKLDELATPLIEYNGYRIRPTPYAVNGQYQTAGIIEKDAPDGIKEHRFVRADTHQNRDDAINFTISKAKQIIDMQGDRMFV
jgi:hypothetical protein